jgi:hypothetical protein
MPEEKKKKKKNKKQDRHSVKVLLASDDCLAITG